MSSLPSPVGPLTRNMTFAEFVSAVSPSESVEYYNRGCYVGTRIPLRQIPADTAVTITGSVATDALGGVAVERVLGDRPRLGARQWRAVHGPDAVRP